MRTIPSVATQTAPLANGRLFIGLNINTRGLRYEQFKASEHRRRECTKPYTTAQPSEPYSAKRTPSAEERSDERHEAKRSGVREP